MTTMFLVTWMIAAALHRLVPLDIDPAHRIDGPYRFSRNPDYLNQALIYAGSSLMAGRLWPLFLLPGALTIVS